MANRHCRYILDVYNVEVHIAVTPPQLKDLMRHFIDHKSPLDGYESMAGCAWEKPESDDNPHMHHICFWIDQALWLERGGEASKMAELCAHEAVHGAGMIWKYISAKLNHNIIAWDEPFAYLVGSLTDRLFQEAYA